MLDQVAARTEGQDSNVVDNSKAAPERADSAQDGDSIIAACRPLMASFKVPRRVVIVSEWPLTESGKIQKHVLRARVAGDSDSLIGATG